MADEGNLAEATAGRWDFSDLLRVVGEFRWPAKLYAHNSVSPSFCDVTDFGLQRQNSLSVTNQNVEAAIRTEFMLENQPHASVADIHCFGRLGKRDSILTCPVNNDGNRKR